MPQDHQRTSVSKFRSAEFISKIVQDADTGWGFVPLVGSGLSSPSGIIMGMEFTNYLAFAAYLVLSDPKTRDKTHGEGKPQRWSLKVQGWPPLPSEKEVEAARSWIMENFKKLCDRLQLSLNYDKHEKTSITSLAMKGPQSTSQELVSVLSRPMIPSILASNEMKPTDEMARRFVNLLAKGASSDNYPGSFAVDELIPDPCRSYHQRIVEMGIRSLHDWRETLVFLACVRVERSGERLSFSSQQDASVIDAFNTSITRDRKPNLGHKMLAHLASSLRIQTILTTNFDTLLEDAYRSLKLSIRVLPVSSKGRLPESRTVAADDSLVKLHGEAHDTRADMTLDEEPLREDLTTFASYLSRVGTQSVGNGEVESKRLLVIGYSGSDYRCIQMIKHWIESASDQAIVYWVCYSSWDVKKVEAIFNAEQYRGRIRVTQTTRPDLLLYELYQRIVLSLPPGGLTYEFSHIVPPRRMIEFESPREQVQSLEECVDESANLFESARVLVGNLGTLRNARRLARDTNVSILRNRIVEILSGAIGKLDDISAPTVGLPSPKYWQWKPWYRTEGDTEAVTRPVVVDSPGGVVRACSLAVDEISTHGVRVFWMETQDYMDVDAMIRDFLRGLALRCGLYQSNHITLHPLDCGITSGFASTQPAQQSDFWKVRAERISEHLKHILVAYRSDPKSIKVLLYGRDSYGSCAGLIPSVWMTNSVHFKALHCFIEALALSGIQVVYFPLLSERAQAKRRRVPGDMIAVVPSEKLSGASEAYSAEWDSWPSDIVIEELLQKLPDDKRQTIDDKRKIEEPILAAMSTYSDLLGDVLQKYFDISEANTTQGASSKTLNAAVRSLLTESRSSQHLTFLYSLTLFRHSRHPNALCSEATFQCPLRHNIHAADNDFIRSEESADWIASLRDAGVFLDKPGGAVWMHRDMRLSLQKTLESINLCPHDNSRRCYRRAEEMRARLHFWIGDWYFKAFCSSGHLTPIIEAIHHRMMAALFSQIARPKYRLTNRDGSSKSATDMDNERKNECRYRSLLFKSCLLEAEKTLLMAQSALKLWQASSFDASWMDSEHRSTLETHLLAVAKKLEVEEATVLDPGRRAPAKKKKNASDNLSLVVYQFLETLKKTCDSLTLEGGGPREANSAAGSLNKNAPGHNESQDEIEQGPRRKLTLNHGWEAICQLQSSFESAIKEQYSELGGDSLFAQLQAFEGGSNESANAELIESFSTQKAIWKHENARNPQQIGDMIWLLGETAFLLLRRAKMTFHATGEINRKRWLQSTVACNLGIDMCKHLPARYLQFDIDSKVKLHSLYSVGLANLGRFFEANRHLNEAQAILSKSGSATDSDYAIISLRRAEVRLTECFWIALFIDDDADLCDGNFESPKIGRCFSGSKVVMIDGDLRHTGWSSSRIKNICLSHNERSVLVPPRISECIRKAGTPYPGSLDKQKLRESARQHLQRLYSSTLDEAVALLDQAEKGLGGSSQSSLWWSRLHTLRLRVFGLLEPLKESADACLIHRKHSADMGIHENFKNALRIASGDVFRQFRVLRYFFDANEWHRKYFNDNGVSTGQSSNKTKHITLLPDTYRLAQDAAHSLLNNRELTGRGILGNWLTVTKISLRDRKQNPLEAAIIDLLHEHKFLGRDGNFVRHVK
jgi:hypothetical protein